MNGLNKFSPYTGGLQSLRPTTLRDVYYIPHSSLLIAHYGSGYFVILLELADDLEVAVLRVVLPGVELAFRQGLLRLGGVEVALELLAEQHVRAQITAEFTVQPFGTLAVDDALHVRWRR